MFMVCATLLSRDSSIVDRSCRPTMLHYRSTLLHVLKTFAFSPALIFGNREEKQTIALELFGNFEEDQVNIEYKNKTIILFFFFFIFVFFSDSSYYIGVD